MVVRVGRGLRWVENVRDDGFVHQRQYINEQLSFRLKEVMLSYVKYALLTSSGSVNYETVHWMDFVSNHNSFRQLHIALRRDNLLVSSITQERVEITAENYDTLEHGLRICVLYVPRSPV